MKLLHILILFLSFQLFGQQDNASSSFNAIDSLMTSTLQEYHIPGASLIIVENDSVVFSKGYGYADLENNILFDPQTTAVRCGSVSKSFTATAAMILVDRGKLDLNKSISNYLTEKELKDFGIGDKKITTHQLLTHSAGFDERLFGSHVESFDKWMDLKDYFLDYPLNFRSEPGEILNYNDQGIALAGYIIEKIAKQPFYDFVRENIFIPLGMKESSFDPSLTLDLKNKLAKSYAYIDGNHTPYNYDYILPYPAAGLVSTPADMAEFIKMHLGAGGQTLTDRALQEMHTQQFANHPKLRGWCYGFAEWFENGERFIFKDGQATGFNSRLFMKPDSNWGFYLVWNRSIFNKAGAIDRSNNLKREVTSLLVDGLFSEADDEVIRTPVGYSGDNIYDFEGNYREMSIGVQDWSKLLTLALQRKVQRVEGATYNIMGGDYIRVDDLLFQWAEGQEFYSAFSQETQDQKIAFVHQGTGSYEKVPKFEDQTLQLILIIMLHLGFLFSVSFGIFHYKKSKNKYFLLFAIGALICFIGLPLLAWNLLSVDFQVLYKGPTPIMTLASWLPFAGSVLLSLVTLKILMSGRKNWLIILTLINVLIVPYLLYWNFPII